MIQYFLFDTDELDLRLTSSGDTIVRTEYSNVLNYLHFDTLYISFSYFVIFLVTFFQNFITQKKRKQKETKEHVLGRGQLVSLRGPEFLKYFLFFLSVITHNNKNNLTHKIKNKKNRRFYPRITGVTSFEQNFKTL